LIGVGVGGFMTGRQMTLWDQPDERDERLIAAMQRLRKRFGDDAIRRASEIGPDGLSREEFD
jgi:hypothetical protein